MPETAVMPPPTEATHAKPEPLTVAQQQANEIVQRALPQPPTEPQRSAADMATEDFKTLDLPDKRIEPVSAPDKQATTGGWKRRFGGLFGAKPEPAVSTPVVPATEKKPVERVAPGNTPLVPDAREDTTGMHPDLIGKVSREADSTDPRKKMDALREGKTVMFKMRTGEQAGPSETGGRDGARLGLTVQEGRLIMNDNTRDAGNGSLQNPILEVRGDTLVIKRGEGIFDTFSVSDVINGKAAVRMKDQPFSFAVRDFDPKTGEIVLQQEKLGRVDRMVQRLQKTKAGQAFAKACAAGLMLAGAGGHELVTPQTPVIDDPESGRTGITQMAENPQQSFPDIQSSIPVDVQQQFENSMKEKHKRKVNYPKPVNADGDSMNGLFRTFGAQYEASKVTPDDPDYQDAQDFLVRSAEDEGRKVDADDTALNKFAGKFESNFADGKTFGGQRADMLKAFADSAEAPPGQKMEDLVGGDRIKTPENNPDIFYVDDIPKLFADAAAKIEAPAKGVS